MRLAVSNIGWAPEHLDAVLPRLNNHNVEGLVIAPTMVWGEGPYVEPSKAVDFRKRMEDLGLAAVGLQSLTFGLTNAALSGDTETRLRLTEHLKRQAELAGHLGAVSLIFGSPGLRKQVDEAHALEVFGNVSATAADNGAKLCIEPLSGYGNNFVTTTADGVRFVDALRTAGHELGVGLHLDAAAIAGQSKPNVLSDLTYAQNTIGITSFDASAPDLLPISSDETVDHRSMAASLRQVGYEGYISLEMRQPQVDDPMSAFFGEVDLVRDLYDLDTR